MTRGFSSDALDTVRQRMLRDLEHAVVSVPALSLYDVRTRAGAGPERGELADFVADDTPPGTWARFGTHTVRLTAPDAAALLVALANAVQDDIIDLQGRPWPEVGADAGFAAAVLTPTRSDSGQAIWSDGGRQQAPIGNLDAFGAHIVT